MKNLDRLCAEYGYKLADEVSRIMFYLQADEEIIDEIIDELKKGKLHNKLKEEFNKRKIPLGAVQINQKDDKSWIMRHDKNEFILERQGKTLLIYKKDLITSDATKAETLITKALGVLQEQGLYAFVLFCVSRGSAEKSGAERIKEITRELLLEDKLRLISGDDDLLKAIRNLVSRLDELVLAIQVLEKSLIYARFHAKAMAESQGEGEK